MKSKKLLSVLLATILLLTCIPLYVSANEYFDERGYFCTVIDGEATITGYYGSSGAITIPSTLGGYPVTSIGDDAFNDCDSLTSVTIPDSVTSIGDYAFYDCTSLTSVTVGDSVTSIGNSAFSSCDSLTSINVDQNSTKYCSVDGVLFNKDKTTLIQYPAGKTLTAYSIPDSVTSIGESAFRYCTSLTSTTIPDNVTSIGDYAFNWCDNLTSVTIGNSVTSIGDWAFGSCTSLTSVTIPDSVTSIGDYAFYDCDSLTSVTIPDSVTSIGSGAFRGCSSLTSVTIPDSVTSIGDSAFYYCTNLTSVTIPEGVTTIGWYAFSSCDSLTSVTIPEGVTSIGSYAFYKCTSLTDVYYGGTETNKAAITIGSYNDSLLNATWHYADDPISDDVTHSVMDTANGNGLAFRFELSAKGVVKNNRNVMDLANATIDYWGKECKLISMGTVVTNNSTVAEKLTADAVNDYDVVNVPTVYLQQTDEDSCAFAARVIDIPDTFLERIIYARPYFIVEVDGEEITVYGEVDSATCAEYL